MLDAVREYTSEPAEKGNALDALGPLNAWAKSSAPETSAYTASATTAAVSFPDFPSDDLSGHVTDCACLACSSFDPFKDDVERSGEITGGETTSAGAEASLQEMADFLSLGYWNNSTGLRHNVGSTGTDANNGVLLYNVSGFSSLQFGGGSDGNGISEARKELVRDAFDIYEAVLGIDFQETTSDDENVVDFFFKDNDTGAYAGSPRFSDGTIAYSYINVSSSWSGGTSTYDDYTLQTILHEIGHALGLGHQGPYNGSATYSDDATYEHDSWQASMMSYFSQTQNTAINASREFLQTPMAVDWIALNDIYSPMGYGTNNAFTENTTWGFNTTITDSVSRIWADWENWADRTASTIIDAGGIDTLDVSGYSADQKLDLTVQTASMTEQNTSNIGGRIGNLTLAIGTVIENAIGGAGDDAFIGNNANNVFTGGGGDDTFFGALGNDQFLGGAGFDTVTYSSIFADYGFTILSDAIEIVGEGVDLVFDTIEAVVFTDITYSYTDLLALFPPSPVPTDDILSISGLDFTLTDYDASQNEGAFSISSDGLTLTQTENTWTTASLAGGLTVTANTVLEFDFSAPLEGEIHAIEFDNDGVIDAGQMFQVWGSQDYGIRDATYDGSGTDTFVFNVGEYFTGSGFNLNFVSDDDAGGSAGSVFSNLRVYEGRVAEGLSISGTEFDLAAYDASQNTGSFALSTDGTTLTQTENSWTTASTPGGLTVTANTVLEFDFSAPLEGEIHAIEFDNDGVIDAGQMFQVWGSQDYGIRDATYDGSGTDTFVFNVGEYFTGSGFNLNFVSDDDAGGSAGSVFSNVRVYEANADDVLIISDTAYAITEYKQNTGTSTVSPDGRTLTQTSDAWIELTAQSGDATILTEDTVLTFDFSAPSEGEIHGVSFLSEGDILSEVSFKVYGSQDWGIQDFDTYSGSGTQTFEIAVGQYITGAVDQILFFSDDDASLGAGSVFSNITLSDLG